MSLPTPPTEGAPPPSGRFRAYLGWALAALFVGVGSWGSCWIEPINTTIGSGWILFLGILGSLSLSGSVVLGLACLAARGQAHNARLRLFSGGAIAALLITAGTWGSCASGLVDYRNHGTLAPAFGLAGCVALPAGVILLITWAAARGKRRP